MSKETAGYLVEYTDKEGHVQTGVVRHIDQHPSFVDAEKVFVRLTNADGSFKTDENQKKMVSLKAAYLLKQIGFID